MEQKSRLQKKYLKEVVPALMAEFNIKNRMAVPKVEKVIINMGVGKMVKEKELKDTLSKDLAAISGQKPSVRLSKVSVAAFNLRQGMPVGLSVTIRGARMYDFLDKLFSVVLPRLRDFRGVKLTSFDKAGNYTLGLSEHTVFPEIDTAKVGLPQGLEVVMVISAGSPERSKRLFELLGMPFEKG